jgi:hypothetical protein
MNGEARMKRSYGQKYQISKDVIVVINVDDITVTVHTQQVWMTGQMWVMPHGVRLEHLDELHLQHTNVGGRNPQYCMGKIITIAWCT